MVLVFETSEPSSMTHLSNKAIPPNPPGTVPPEYLNMNLLGTILIQINTYTHATKEIKHQNILMKWKGMDHSLSPLSPS